VSTAARPSCLCVHFFEKLNNLLDRLDNRCTVLKVTHLSECTGVESTPITVAARCFTGYKYPHHLALITISHPIFLDFLGFFSLTIC
jgi:hypothetical protein